MGKGREYHGIINGIIVKKEHDSIFAEYAITVSINDEGAGCFIEIKQDQNCIYFDVDMWQALKSAIEQIANICDMQHKQEKTQEKGI